VPVRTPRGRAGAYRGLWQWPLRSPRRLAAVGLGVVAVLAGITVLISLLADPSRSATPSPSGSQSNAVAPSRSAGASTTGLPPVAELTPTLLPLTQAPPAALTAASSWATAWATHPAGATTEQWLAGLRPFTTPEYLAVLGNTDPANVPATSVTGPPKPVLVSPRSLRVEVPTNALTLLLLVVDYTGNGDWRVAGHDRADAVAGG